MNVSKLLDVLPQERYFFLGSAQLHSCVIKSVSGFDARISEFLRFLELIFDAQALERFDVRILRSENVAILHGRKAGVDDPLIKLVCHGVFLLLLAF